MGMVKRAGTLFLVLLTATVLAVLVKAGGADRQSIAPGAGPSHAVVGP